MNLMRTEELLSVNLEQQLPTPSALSSSNCGPPHLSRRTAFCNDIDRSSEFLYISISELLFGDWLMQSLQDEGRP